MNDKSKRLGCEEIFEVFRLEGEPGLSSENYVLKKQAYLPTATRPLTKNQVTEVIPSLSTQIIEPHPVQLSNKNLLDTSADLITAGAQCVQDAPPSASARLDTFRINMEERIAAMGAAQQKAKNQLTDFEKQHLQADDSPLA
jgi:hypothetical protein